VFNALFGCNLSNLFQFQNTDCVYLDLYTKKSERLKVENKLHVGTREQKTLITADLDFGAKSATSALAGNRTR
jgi:hypothetical protein